MAHKQKQVRRGRWRKTSDLRRKANLDFEKENLAPPTKFGSGPINLVATLVIIGLITTFFFLRPDDAPVEKNTSSDSAPRPTQALVNQNVPMPHEIIKDFREAESFEDIFIHLAHPELVEDRAREFFTSGPGKEEKIRGLKIAPRIDNTSRLPALKYIALMEDGGKRHVELLLYEDGPKIDFDFYAGYSEVPWSELLDGTTLESPESRVILSEYHYYSGEFSDDSKWQSFRARSMNFEGNLVLYLDRTSPFLPMVQKITKSSPVRTNLALRTTAASLKTRQFEIQRVHALSWRTLTKEQRTAAEN